MPDWHAGSACMPVWQPAKDATQTRLSGTNPNPWERWHGGGGERGGSAFHGLVVTTADSPPTYVRPWLRPLLRPLRPQTNSSARSFIRSISISWTTVTDPPPSVAPPCPPIYSSLVHAHARMHACTCMSAQTSRACMHSECVELISVR